MPGLLLNQMEQPEVPTPKAPGYGFVVSHQKVELEVDFSTQSLTGRTEITALPLQKTLRNIRIDARQCTIPVGGITVNGKVAKFGYEDPMKLLDVPPYYNWDAHQHELQKSRLRPLVDDDARAQVALDIEIPKTVGIEEVNPFSESAANALTERAIGASAARHASIVANGLNEPQSAVPMTPKTATEQLARFQPLVVSISFSIARFRDGLHFVGLGEGDRRFPHVYTQHSVDPGTASCVFPCVDDPAMRCSWELVIKCSRTLGDALKKRPKPSHHTKQHANSITSGVNGLSLSEESDINEDDKLLEMMIVCSGELLNETVDPDDSSKKIVTFEVGTIVAAKHVGFAIGPFEQVDLSEFRDEEDEEKLGQGQSVPVSAFCLPGRAEEARNTCAPMAHAMDWFSLNFAGFPFTDYKMVFVNDQIRDIEHTAGLSLCDIRLLCPEDIIDPEIENTRALVHALASQWMGVTVVPNERMDRWITVGLSHFMTGMFMKVLCGNNEFMFRQKLLADRLVELDVDRPPLHALGEILHLGSFEYEFMALKAPLVLFILDRRIIKEAGTQGISRVITKIAMGANTGAASESIVSTEHFRRQVEKITKYRKTEPFWNQWVLASGCPRFVISQKFNKKRLMIEMKIYQKQDTLKQQTRKLQKSEFLRELKEDVNEVFAGDVQSMFTGSMTIRIHEADGTPYEHVVEIREGNGQIDIPYSTKYKRLKRSRRQKERAAAGGGGDVGAEPGEDALIYCLGDILQSQREMQEWGLVDWNDDQQQEMENESYEWFRIDADFEWLCSKQLLNMKPWMYMSQLQQDRDVVAQQESLIWLKTQAVHPLAATFLVRTLMDRRYYYGIRQMAADCLAAHADPVANWIGWRHLEKAFSELFCHPGTKMPRPNDFSYKQGYWVSNAILKAVSQIRHDGKCPKMAKQFILDQLRFNDNAHNRYSDNYKIANLLTALADSLLPIKKDKSDGLEEMVFAADDDDEDNDEPRQFRDTVIEELDRYRRSDEWTHSFQNIYTTTVLECKRKLMKAGVIPQDPSEIAQYLLDGTSAHVRTKAWEALVDLGLLTDPSVAALLLNVLSTDPSPYMRNCLFKIFCFGLSSIALDENAPEASQAGGDGEGDMLIIEEEASSEARKAYIARTTSMDGAIAALKVELEDNLVLKDAIWKAVQSPIITLSEEYDLLDVCWVLYEIDMSLILKLRYPRYWAVENLGKVICSCNQS